MKIQNSELLIFSLNCLSFESKFNQLNIFINEINTKTCVSIIFIALQETWLSELSDISVFQIPNYNIVSSVSKSSKHGGLIFYIHFSFSYTIHNFTHSTNIWDSLFVDIVHTETNRKYIIGNLYRLPLKHIENLNIFLDEFSDILQIVSTDKCKCFVFGDTNVDLLKLQSTNNYQRLYNDLLSSSFIPLITLPTRLSTTCNTLIDNAFTNHSTDNISSGIISSHFSDHRMYFTN